jgi:phage I-like protein
MNPELLKLLGLAADATEDQIVAACQALVDTNADLTQQVKDKDTAIAAATAATPDSAIDLIKEQGETIAVLTARLDGNDKDSLIAAAKADGKVTPAQETWLQDQDIDVVKSFVDAAAPIAALTTQQTDGKKLDEDGNPELNEEQLAVCAQLDIDPEEYKKQLAQEAN